MTPAASRKYDAQASGEVFCAVTVKGKFHMSPAVTVVALILALLIPNAAAEQAAGDRPLRLAIAGLVHGHVSGFLRGAQGRQDVEIVGVFDPDNALLQQYADRYKIPEAARFTNLDDMLRRTAPE